jgi:hypothetical protein
MYAASVALDNYLGAGAVGTQLDLNPEDLADARRIYTAGPNPPYQLMVLLGLPGDWLGVAVQKLARLMDPAAGALLAVCTSPATLADAAAVQAILADITRLAVGSSLQAARHDDLAGPLPNSVLGLQWPASRPA